VEDEPVAEVFLLQLEPLRHLGGGDGLSAGVHALLVLLGDGRAEGALVGVRAPGDLAGGADVNPVRHVLELEFGFLARLRVVHEVQHLPALELRAHSDGRRRLAGTGRGYERKGLTLGNKVDGGLLLVSEPHGFSYSVFSTSRPGEAFSRLSPFRVRSLRSPSAR